MSFVIGTPHTKRAGYYLNDDRPSGGKKTEADIQTCTHCQKVLVMKEWTEDGGYCSRCAAPICGPCADKMLTDGCVPFVKLIEQEADMAVKLDTFRKLAGLDAAIPQAIIQP
jgi:hypothetical protein